MCKRTGGPLATSLLVKLLERQDGVKPSPALSRTYRAPLAPFQCRGSELRNGPPSSVLHTSILPGIVVELACLLVCGVWSSCVFYVTLCCLCRRIYSSLVSLFRCCFCFLISVLVVVFVTVALHSVIALHCIALHWYWRRRTSHS